MAKKITANLKMRLPAGRASAGPPVGSILGQHGLNLMDLVQAFNDRTKELNGKHVLVHVRVYEDRTMDFDVLGQPVDDLIRQAIKLEKGSGRPHVDKVGKITKAQVKEIAEK